MRPLKSKEKIRPLRSRRPSQLYLDKDGKAALTPSSEQYKEMGGKEFLQNWMNSPQYQDMMSGKEDFTREKYAGHYGEKLAFFAADDPIKTNIPQGGRKGPDETELIELGGITTTADLPNFSDSTRGTREYLTEDQLYERLRDLGYGDNASITDMRRKNLDSAVVTEGWRNSNSAAPSQGRPKVKLNYNDYHNDVLGGGENQDPNNSRLETHELSHASDTDIYDHSRDFRPGERYPVVRTVGYRGEPLNALIPKDDQDLLNRMFLDNMDEARRRTKAGEPLGRFAGYADGSRGLHTSYYTDPSEVRARLNVIRKLAGETGIYDPFNERLTMEGLEQLYDDMNANSKKRKDRAKDSGIFGEVQKAGKYKPLTELNKYYTKEQILELLNEVAYNKPSSDGSGMTVLRA